MRTKRAWWKIECFFNDMKNIPPFPLRSAAMNNEILCMRIKGFNYNCSTVKLLWIGKYVSIRIVENVFKKNYLSNFNAKKCVKFIYQEDNFNPCMVSQSVLDPSYFLYMAIFKLSWYILELYVYEDHPYYTREQFVYAFLFS